MVAFFVVGILGIVAFVTPAAQAQDGGSVSEIVYWIDQYGNARPMPWAQVVADDVYRRSRLTRRTEATRCGCLQGHMIYRRLLRQASRPMSNQALSCRKAAPPA